MVFLHEKAAILDYKKANITCEYIIYLDKKSCRLTRLPIVYNSFIYFFIFYNMNSLFGLSFALLAVEFFVILFFVRVLWLFLKKKRDLAYHNFSPEQAIKRILEAKNGKVNLEDDIDRQYAIYKKLREEYDSKLNNQ